MNRKVIFVACFLSPILLLLQHLNQFPFQPGATYTDLLISHYPNGLFIQKSITMYGTIPLWSDMILSGYPFAANPLSGLFYLPGWLALIFQLPLGFNLAVILHIIFGGVGTYCFLRQENLSPGPALLGALIFESMPKLFSHLGAGHITLIYAVTWTPWLLYFEKKTFSTQHLRWILPGAILGLIALADIRWAAYSGLLWLAYSMRLSIGLVRQQAKNWTDWLHSGWLPSRVTNLLFAGFVAAPLLLPLFEYVRLSTRNQLGLNDNFILSLPFGQMFGLVYPNIGGMAEWVLYSGTVSIAMLVLTLSNKKNFTQASFWLGVLGVSLIFALGSNLAPLALLGRLPGLDLLRVPPRSLFLAGFAFAVIAGYATQHLLEFSASDKGGASIRGGMVLFGVTAFVVLLAIAIQVMVDRPMTRLQFAWGAVSLLTATTIITLAIKKRLSPPAIMTWLWILTLIDLSGVNALSLEFKSPATVFGEKSAVVDYLKKQGAEGLYRVYSPSYSLPQHIAERANIQLADGVDPLQLAAYVRYMEAATGIPNRGYSVTLPPYPNAQPETDNQGYQPDAEKLGLLNVKYILSDFPLYDPELKPLEKIDRTIVYLNSRALPRAWVQAPDALPGQAIKSVPALYSTANRISATAEGPGELVLSEIAYPGWQAAVDGKRVPIIVVGNLLRGIQLNPGSHHVTFEFRPVTVYLGLVISGVAWVIFCVVFYLRSRVHA